MATFSHEFETTNDKNTVKLSLAIAIFFYALGIILFLVSQTSRVLWVTLGLGTFVLLVFVVDPYRKALTSVEIQPHGVLFRTRSGRESFERWGNISGFVMDSRTYPSLGLIYVADKPYPYSIPRVVADRIWEAYREGTGAEPPVWVGKIRRNRTL